MNNAIETLSARESERRLLMVADAQNYFMENYGQLLKGRARDEFMRDLLYLVHLIYREAQEPLVKQLTDFVMTHTRPLIMEIDKERKG